MSTKPRMLITEPRGDVTLDPFQLDALRPLLLEQERRIKNHVDHRIDQLTRLLERSDSGDSREREAKSKGPSQNLNGPSPDQLGLRAGVAPHLLQLIDRIKAEKEKAKESTILRAQVSFISALPSWRSGKWRKTLGRILEMYEHLVDLLVVIYAICVGVEIHYTSKEKSEPTWARTVETAFCCFFSVDLLIRICIERERFATGSRRWWNLVDSVSLSLLLIALAERSRTLGNFVAMQRVGRLLRLPRCFAKWAQLQELRIMLGCMAESFKVMVWLVLLVIIFIYFYSLLLTELIWETCPNEKTAEVCKKFGDLLSSQMTLYQIMYSGLLWGDLWEELRVMDWYIQIIFLSYVVFALMVLVNTITSFICSLQSTVSKKERDVLIANEMDYNERLVRQLYTIFQDFDQNGNGAISWAEFQLALEDERMLAFLNALELDMSDAVKVFQILASEKTGSIEESNFLLGCLRLRGGATTVDMVAMQMEQEWMRGALLQMKGLMHTAIGDLKAVQHTLERKSLWGESENRIERRHSIRGNWKSSNNLNRQSSSQSSVSASSDELGDELGDEPVPYQRTNLQTFERALTLEQLKIISQKLDRWCRGWTDAFTGAVVSVAKVNLHQFSYHHSLPRTAPPDGVLLQWPASLVKDLPDVGSTVFQTCPHMKLPRASGKVISAETANENGMNMLTLCVQLVQGQFRGNEEEEVSIGDFELPAREMTVTARSSISYKELLSSEACSPVWYCSHWWGEPVRDFVNCCQEHANVRRLGDQGSYWVCGYANRQHELDQEIAEDVMQTSFFAALKASRGLLLILDEDATPFSRIWCDYEVYSAVMNPNMELDLVISLNMHGRQEAKIITRNLVPGESAVAKLAREQDFPIFLLDRGLQVCLEKGNSTMERDKISIFQAIAQSKELESARGKEQLQRNLARANQTLHSTLAILAWPQAMNKNLLPKNAKGLHAGKLNVCDALLNDTFRESLDLSLAHYDESCADSAVKALAESLPPCLVNLKLSFEGCVRLTDVSLQALAARIGQMKLQKLHLDFIGCKNLSDAGLRLLAAALQKSTLVELELHLAGCVRVHSQGISQLRENLPASLRSFKGSFKGTEVNRNFQNLIDFQEFKAKTLSSTFTA